MMGGGKKGEEVPTPTEETDRAASETRAEETEGWCLAEEGEGSGRIYGEGRLVGVQKRYL